jgi:uncharacterized protein
MMLFALCETFAAIELSMQRCHVDDSTEKKSMSLTMYRISVPVFERALGILSNYLKLAAEFCAAQQMDEAALVNARLAPDMLPLSGQIQRASDTTKNAIARLSGLEAPRLEDNETNLVELQTRIDKTLAFFDTVRAAEIDGSDQREITLAFGKLKATVNGEDYLLQFTLPNLFFHVATTHAILRAQGVPVGKLDYIGALG